MTDKQCEQCGEINPAEIHTCSPQGPVAWMYNGNLHEFDPSDWAESEVIPLYTAPSQREWQGLTDEEVLADDVLRYHFGLNGGAGGVSKKGKAVIAATEAKLKEKNT